MSVSGFALSRRFILMQLSGDKLVDWILVTDRLPDKNKLVLVTHAAPRESPDVCSAYHDGDRWKTEAGDSDGESYDLDYVTHWMAYPPPAPLITRHDRNKKR